MPSVSMSNRLALGLSVASLVMGTINLLGSGTNAKFVKKTPTVSIRNENVLEVKSSSGWGVAMNGSGTTTMSGKLLMQRPTDVGWSIVVGENAACNTTCTSACVAGQTLHTGTGLVSCTNATADQCLCAGPS